MTREVLIRRFGEMVRRLRLEKGYSQERFADLCGLHRTYIGTVERSEKVVTIATAARIAKTLGTTLTGLFAEVEREPEAPPEDLQHP